MKMKRVLSACSSTASSAAPPPRNTHKKKKIKMSCTTNLWTKDMDTALLQTWINLCENTKLKCPCRSSSLWDTAKKNFNNLLDQNGRSNCGPVDKDDLYIRLNELKKEYRNAPESPIKTLVYTLFFDMSFAIPEVYADIRERSRSPSRATTDSTVDSASNFLNDLDSSAALYDKFSIILKNLNIPRHTLFRLLEKTKEKQRRICVGMKDLQEQTEYVTQLIEDLEGR